MSISEHEVVNVGASDDVLGSWFGWRTGCSQFLPIPDPRTSILFSAPMDHEASEGDIRRPRGFLFFSIYRYPISASRNVYSGLVSSHRQRKRKETKREKKRMREREGGEEKREGGEGKRREERERESERKKKIKKRKKRTFFTIPLLDELARYRVAWRSNRTERGGERDETEEGNIESVGWGVWTALPRWTQRIAITNWQAWLMVSAEGTTPADPLAGREEERERRIGREERREKGNRMCQETEGVATGRRGCRPSEMEWM